MQLTLKKYFGHDEFRPGQQEIINSLISGKDTLAVMPTGGGKSLCYQLPALISEGTAIVISPLIALMKDQIDALHRKGISADLINSSIPYPEIINRMESAVQGYYKLLYIAPERLESNSFLKKLAQIDISFIAVDEAHCISEWGHDFRPAYMNISKALKYIGKPPLIALTATATPEVQADICKSLEMKEPNLFIKGFERPNLIYRVEKPKDKNRRIIELFDKTTDGSIVIYCGSRSRVEKTVEYLRQNSVQAEGYHGGMKPIVRKAVQERFISGKSRVIVATNAFGMGIDKPDVRRVIHADITMTLEAYYQEAGRAGRDGKQSICTILYDEKDINLQNFFIDATYPKIDDFQKLYVELKKLAQSSEIIMQSLNEIANQASLPIFLATNIMEYFERSQIISYINSSNESEIKFTAPIARLKEYLEYTSEDRREVLKSLMRNATQEAFDKFVPINIHKIKRDELIGIKDFEQIIMSLQYDDLLTIKNNSISSGIRLNINVPSVGSLPIDFHGIQKRKVNAVSKLNKVLDYIETKNCKRNFILNYFGEHSFTSDCGRCSSCTKDSSAYLLDQDHSKIMLEILQCAKDLKNNFQKQTLIDVLLGKDSLQIKNFSLNQMPSYSSIGHISEIELEIVVSKALSRKYLEISSDEFHPIIFTDLAHRYLEENLNYKNTKKMIENKQFDEKLYNRLVKLRTEIAENAGVVPRGIVSDIVLKKITDAKPIDDEDLRNLSGISQLFTEKYGHLFVKEINDYEQGQSFDPSKLSKLAKDTLKLADQGLTFDKITQRMFNNKQMVANNLYEAINEGAKMNIEQFFSPDDYNHILEVTEQNPDDTIKELYRKSNNLIDEHLFKIGVALARRDIMRKSKNLKSSIL